MNTLSWRDLLRLGLTLPVMGGELDGGAGTAAGVPDGSLGEGSGAGDGGAVPDGDGAADGADDGYEIGGQRYTPDQLPEALRDALESHTNKADWERTFKQREMREAAVRKALEQAFGRRLTEFGPNDLRDLQAFGQFNTQLRTDRRFAAAWETALTQAYKEAGLSPAAAAATARQDVRDAKTGKETETPPLDPAVADRLKKVDELEAREQAREHRALGVAIDRTINSTLVQVAKGLEDDHDLLRDRILYKLAGYDNQELVQLAESGELVTIISERAREFTKQLRDRGARRRKSQAEALATAKTGAGIPPNKGTGAGAPATPEVAPQRGKGLKSMHRSMREALTSQAS